jgi:hypothetical protein
MKRYGVVLLLLAIVAVVLPATPARAGSIIGLGWNVECRGQTGAKVDPFAYATNSVQCVSLHATERTPTGYKIDLAQVQWFIRPDQCFGTQSMCGYDGTDAQHYTCYRPTMVLLKNGGVFRASQYGRLCPHVNTRVLAQWNIASNYGKGTLFQADVRKVPPYYDVRAGIYVT